MLHTLRAFAWLRWRMFVNSLEQTGSRDMLERFSLAIDKLGTVLAAVLLIPSALTLAALGAASGYALANGDSHSIVARLPRYFLSAVPLLSIVGPLLMPAADRTNPVRMLLLPIGRGTLYVAQSAAALADVWVLLMLPVIACIPLGLAAGGAPGAAAVSAVAGGVLLLIVLALSSATTSLLHLAVRDRRRGELLALLFLLFIPMVGMLPSIVAATAREETSDGGAFERAGSGGRAWLGASARHVAALYPPELYTGAARSAAAHAFAPAAQSIGALAAMAIALNGLGIYVFAKVLDSPGSTSARRGGRATSLKARRLPGLSPGASAVALGQFRLALRTPRGRSILLSPIALVVGVAVLGRQKMPQLWAGAGSDPGLILACFGSFICLISILPVALNQFAIDKGGLTRVLLSPLSERDYLRGKAAGNGMIAAVPILLCLAASFFAIPGERSSMVSWAGIPIGLLSTYLLVAPVAALLSATFPRVVDLNSIGRGSNAHGLAGLLGFLTFLVAGLPNVAVAMAATSWLDHRLSTLAALLIWCLACYVVGQVLFASARRVFVARRENLAML